MWFEKSIKKEKKVEVVDTVDYEIQRELKNGYKVVKKDLLFIGYRYNVIDLNNNLISKKWFENISTDEEFDEDNYIKVWVNTWGSKLFFNYLKIDGTLRFEKDYNALYKCDNGLILSLEYLRCSDEKNYCYHKKDNTVLGGKYFEMVGYHFNEVVDVKVKDQGYNLFTENGEIVSKTYFDELYNFGDVYVTKLKNEKYTFIDKKANFLTKERFDNVDIKITSKRFKDSDNKLAITQKNELFNLFSIEKGFLSDVWFEEYGDAQDDFIKVKIKGDWYFINKNADLFNIETLEKIR